jgi:hypothetical protein
MGDRLRANRIPACRSERAASNIRRQRSSRLPSEYGR